MVRSISLPAKLLSLEDISYDLKIELSLFKSKFETSLFGIVFDPLRLSEVKSLSELDLSPLKDWFFEEIKLESDLDIKDCVSHEYFSLSLDDYRMVIVF